MPTFPPDAIPKPAGLGHNPPMTIHRLLLALLLSAFAASCATTHDTSTRASAHRVSGPAGDSVEVTESFITIASPDDELDSLATWTAPDGQVLVMATAKSTHRLVVYDGNSGERLREIGGKGRGPGEFTRPNGIIAYADLVFVTERDVPRVQVLSLPGFEPVGSFGEDVLRSPYGIWLHESAPGALEVFVTDSFMHGSDYSVVPPLEELDQRVRRFRLQLADGALVATYRGSFGDTSQAGALRMVESLWGDPAHDRLLVADEDRRNVSTLREYTLEGRYTGNSLPGSFGGEAEGVSLWDCGPEEGYWIAVDQLVPHSLFHVHERASLAYRGSFRGGVTANTDGIALHLSPMARFPAGVMYAVHDDRSISAFDLRHVIQALDLDQVCLH